jgi:RNA polymerase primary sigma factor
MLVIETMLDVMSHSELEVGSVSARSASSAGALDQATKESVYGQWRRGVSMEILSRQHGRSVAAVKRVINEIRARRILSQKLEYVYHGSFDEPGAAATILEHLPADSTNRAVASSTPPPGVPAYLAELYGLPLLSRAQEQHLFRKMNYLKHCAAKIRQSLDPARATAAILDEIERLQKEALDAKNQIIRANLRLVVSIAKKHMGRATDLFELVSDGNVSLIRAVEKFDFSRGFRFSTYATWAISRNFGRALAAERTRRERFVTGRAAMLEDAADRRAADWETESDRVRERSMVRAMLGKLDQRERRILVGRYGIDGADQLNLPQLGVELGITKERVRQLEWRAHEKLRKFAGL